MPPHRRDRQGVKKGAWSLEEDEVLRQHVGEHGEKDWSSIQSNGLLRRTGKSCRLRWVNKLHPDLKSGKFSPEEERVVLDLQAQLGNRWAMIATRLPGRTDNDVKNFWSSRQKRLARLLQELPPRKGNVRKSSRSSRDRLVQQEPGSSKITYNVGQNSSQDPHEVKHYIKPPLPGVLRPPAPVDTAMEIDPGSCSIVPFSTCAENPVPGAGANLPWPRHAGSQTGNTYAAPSHEFHAQQATTFDVVQNSSQDPHEVKQCIDAPLPGVLRLPAPVNAGMGIEPGSSSIVPFSTYAKNHVPGVGAELASLHYANSQTRNTYAAPSHVFHAQQEPSSSMITFQATTYNTDQNRSQEPRESDTLLPKAIYVPAPGELTIHAAMLPGSSRTTVPFCKTHPENPVPGTRVYLASLHYAVFIEPLAVVWAPLSFGSAPFYDSLNNKPHPPQVIPYFAAATLHQNRSEVRFDDLTTEVLDFFSQP